MRIVRPGRLGQVGIYGAVITSGLVLDGLTTGIKAAYSTRKLLTAYAGSAIRVARTTDHVQTDIGFVSNVLDTATLITFSGGANLVVVTWYDQSGGGHNLTEAEGSAPTIYQGGIKFINTTRPGLDFSGTKLLASATLTQNPVNSLYVNAVITQNSGTRNVIVSGTVANNFDISMNPGTGGTATVNAADFANLGTSSTSANANGSVVEAQYNSSTGAGNFWIDNTNSTFTNAHTFAGGGTFQVGIDPSSNIFNDLLGELIMYDLAGTPSRSAIQANQKAYWGTP